MNNHSTPSTPTLNGKIIWESDSVEWITAHSTSFNPITAVFWQISGVAHQGLNESFNVQPLNHSTLFNY